MPLVPSLYRAPPDHREGPEQVDIEDWSGHEETAPRSTPLRNVIQPPIWVECPSCLRYIERHPITEKDRSKWISKIGAATKRPRPVQHPSATSYNNGCRCERCRAFNAIRLEKYRSPDRKR